MNIFKKKILIINIILTFSLGNIMGQSVCDTLLFLNCDANYIITNNSEEFTQFVHKMGNLSKDSSAKINILHIGDSHLQAGFLTESIKQGLFQYFISEDKIISPGFIFPFTMAQTNNPFFYKVNYTGNWNWTKNVDIKKISKLGLSGITASTGDSSATFSIKMNNSKDHIQKYLFNTIKIFHGSASTTILRANNHQLSSEQGISEITLDNLTDSVSFELTMKDSTSIFELYGIILENNSSPISYHTVGVNGATAQSYLRCEYFSPQLASVDPDLVIISLGTNEAYANHFSALEHEYILKDLVLQIKDVVPNAAILLITPNDHTKYSATNKAVAATRENMIKICNQMKLGYWDYYAVMGGESSINEWYHKGLTGKDKLHFNRKGYEIQGELFTNALIDLIIKSKKTTNYNIE